MKTLWSLFLFFINLQVLLRRVLFDHDFLKEVSILIWWCSVWSFTLLATESQKPWVFWINWRSWRWNVVSSPECSSPFLILLLRLVSRINWKLLTEFWVIQLPWQRFTKVFLVCYIFLPIISLIDKGVLPNTKLLVSLAFIRVGCEGTCDQLFLIVRELEVLRCYLLLIFHSLMILIIKAPVW